MSNAGLQRHEAAQIAFGMGGEYEQTTGGEWVALVTMCLKGAKRLCVISKNGLTFYNDRAHYQRGAYIERIEIERGVSI